MGMQSLSVASRILVVDDQADNLQVLKQILSDDYHLLFAKNGYRAIELAKRQRPDLILLDVMMPDLDGFETCRLLKADSETAKIPIIFVTALSEVDDENRGFECGAVDYITKPLCASIVKARVKTHLSLVRIEELEETQLEVVQRLGRAAEYKDNETGLHVIRMSRYSELIAQALGTAPAFYETLLYAAPMHDIGKIGIPDSILTKPGPLTEEEWVVMRQHPSIGADIIGNHYSPLLKMAKSIALTHHEKWDGSGYPHGIGGKDIPLEGRIVAIADVFDALTTKRPYKEAWPVEKAIDYIRAASGSHFDPHIVPVFLDLVPSILHIKKRWDEDADHGQVQAQG